MSTPHLSRSKNGQYRYRRAVPEALRATIGQLEIKKALGSDYGTAMKRYGEVHKATDRLFENAKQAPLPDARDEVLRVLRKAGASPKQLENIIAGLGWGDGVDGFWYGLVNEYEAAEERGETPPVSLEAIRAIGAEKLPAKTYTIAAALDFYCERKSGTDEALNRQLENRISNLKARAIAAIGRDAVTKRRLEKFTRAEALKIRDALLAEVHPNSVRRMLNIYRAALNKTLLEFDLGLRNPFDKMEIKGAGASKDDRLPFTEKDMADIAGTMVKGPDDALSILWTVLRDTGARLSEIAKRKVAEVDLESASISIPIGKSKNAIRTVPLSPKALEGMRHLAEGKSSADYLFTAYAIGRGPDSASQALMKRLRNKIADPKKAVYSLRHRLKDRLRETDCPADIQEEIMGHDAQNVARNYGVGYSLDKKRGYLERVWNSTPS